MKILILIAYNMGYFVTHIPNTLLSIKFGTRYVLIVSMVLSTTLTFLSPLAAKNFYLLFFLRVLTGASHGSLFPNIQEIIANYAVPAERTVIMLLTHTGSVFSLLILFPAGGYLVQNVPNGWKYVFYISGGMGCLSLVFLVLFVFPECEENPWMREEERQYIISGIYPNGKPPRKTVSTIPFRRVFFSYPIFCFSTAHFGKLMMLYMSLYGLPTYFFRYYDISMFQAGCIAFIPFAFEIIGQLVYSRISVMISRTGIGSIRLRRLNTFIGSCGCSISLLIVAFLPCTSIIPAVILISINVFSIGPFQAGYMMEQMEWDPFNAGIVMSIVNIAGSISGVCQLLLNLLFRYLTPISTQEIYKNSFIVTSFVSFFMTMIYVVLGPTKYEPRSDLTVQKQMEVFSVPKAEDSDSVDDESQMEQIA
ncbi:hypothetical protein MXB_5068 [Myxobolus squamalis]|nr:hypothetical protein MXB_5068 [Myxobolus squamalis]